MSEGGLTSGEWLSDHHPDISREAEEFARASKRAYVFCETKGGGVHGWPLTPFHSPGRISFTTYRKTPKVAHLSHVSEVCVVLVSNYGVDPIRYVVVDGRIKVLDIAPEMIPDIMRRLNRTRKDDVTERFERSIRNGQRVILDVEITGMKLPGETAAMTR